MEAVEYTKKFTSIYKGLVNDVFIYISSSDLRLNTSDKKSKRITQCLNLIPTKV
jgi:hypothetical protein